MKSLLNSCDHDSVGNMNRNNIHPPSVAETDK